MNDHRLPLSLVILLGIIVGLAVLGLGRGGAHSIDGAVRQLQAGSLEQDERDALLEVLVERGTERAMHDRRAAQLLVAASIALGDRDALGVGREALGGPTCFHRSEATPRDIETLSLGEPAVHALFLGMLAEASGTRVAARPHYERAVASGRMWARPLAVELGREGLDRVQ